MHIDQARLLQETLQRAVVQAEQAGSTEVDLGASLRAADDAARAELQAAIDAKG